MSKSWNKMLCKECHVQHRNDADKIVIVETKSSVSKLEFFVPLEAAVTVDVTIKTQFLH